MSPLATVVIRREVKDTVTDWRIMVPMLTLALLFPLILVGTTKIGLPYMERVDPVLAQEKAALFGAVMAAFFPISFSLVIALESFAGEKERNTLEALLVSPISDGEMFFGKFVAVLIPPTALSLTGLVVYSVGAALVMGTQVPLEFLALAVLLSFVQAFTMVAAAVVVSSQTATVKAANLLASFIIIPVALVVQGEVLLLFTGYAHLLWLIMAAFLVFAAALVRVGVQIFNREEILTREGDQFSLGAVWTAVRRFWRRPPRDGYTLGGERPISLWRLYRTDVPQLLVLRRGQLAVCVGFLIAGAAIGLWFAAAHPLPLQTAGAAAQGLQPVVAFSAWDIFLHNLRTMAIAAVLSLFTFGAAGGLTIVLTGAAVGFFLGIAVQAGYDPGTLVAAGVLPHGVFEIPALLLAGALNLAVGMCLMNLPKGHSLGDGLLLNIVNWWKGAAVFVPLLFAAAVVEATVTPLLVGGALGG